MISKHVGHPTARSRAARLSTRTFAAVTQLLPVGIGVVDAAGRFVSLNDAGLNIYGLDSVLDGPADLDDYQARFPLYSLEGRRLEEHDRPIARALSGEQVVDQEVLMRRRSDGVERVLSISAEVLPGRETTLVTFVVIDITERMQATKELIATNALIRSITHGTGDLIAAEDTGFRYIFFNDAYRQEFRRLWGRDIEIGTSMLEALAEWPAECEKARAAWQRAIDGESYAVTLDFGPGASGRQVYDIHYNPIHGADGRLIGAAHILRNVTRREQILEALERSEEALRENDRRKDEFLATLAHELRNPLAPVRTGLELLRREPGDPGTIEMMERQMVQLVRLVDDLLDISRINRGKITLCREAVAVEDVVASAREATDALFPASERTLTVELEPDLPRLDVDFVRAVQMLSNLLNNAMKFTSPDGRVTVSARREEDSVRIAVCDDGTGIEAADLERVFEPFHQGGAVERSGLGIGLTLVRNLAELHGGSVSAASGGEGAGSEFVLRLPAADGKRSAARPLVPVRDGRPLAGQRILVVDDNEDAANALALLLESLGAEVKSAFDGRSALAAAASMSPAVVLLDVGLPDMPGQEVAARLRAADPLQRTRIVAVTGWSREEVRRRGEARVFDAHLVKPVRMETILDVLLGEGAAGGDRP